MAADCRLAPLRVRLAEVVVMGEDEGGQGGEVCYPMGCWPRLLPELHRRLHLRRRQCADRRDAYPP